MANGTESVSNLDKCSKYIISQAIFITLVFKIEAASLLGQGPVSNTLKPPHLLQFI